MRGLRPSLTTADASWWLDRRYNDGGRSNMGSSERAERDELHRIFPGDSEMARRMRAFDWSRTDLGLPEFWPQNLRIAVSLCLTSRFPIVLWWGASLTLLYNDAYISILGETKHPRSLGRPGRELWGEVWDSIGPMLEGVRATGTATWSDDFLCFFNRKLPREEVHVRFTYSPILAADGLPENRRRQTPDCRLASLSVGCVRGLAGLSRRRLRPRTTGVTAPDGTRLG